MLTIAWKDKDGSALYPLVRELSTHGVRCACHIRSDRTFVKLCEVTSDACLAIARFLVRDVLRASIQKVIVQFFPSLGNSEVRLVTVATMQLAQHRGMGETPAFLADIAQRVAMSATDDVWNIEGFLVFRMQDVLGRYQDCMEDVICYMITRGQYDHAVRMVQNVLRTQTQRCQKVVVRKIGRDRYALYDEQGRVVSFNKRGGDELVAAVIEAAPDDVVLCRCGELVHSPYFEVLRAVFPDRVTVVDNCDPQ